MRYLLAILLATVSMNLWAEEGAFEGLVLAKAPVNPSDMESIKRGAKFFATNCMSCHTLVYMRYNKIANDAGITYDKMPINVKTWPYGVTPPDLSLEAGVRGVDWIYTYLHSFYKDPARPTGYNNIIVPNTAMPGIIAAYQGDQELIKGKADAGVFNHEVNWYDLLVLTKQGSMTPDQFDATVTDLVNFLAYSTAPYQEEQHRIGWWVLGFLGIMFVLTYLLKKEYWKDIKKRRDE